MGGYFGMKRHQVEFIEELERLEADEDPTEGLDEVMTPYRGKKDSRKCLADWLLSIGLPTEAGEIRRRK